MNRSKIRLLLLLLGFTLLASGLCLPLFSQTPRRLRSSDFLLPRIPDKADTSIVRRVLGAPDSISKGDDPSQASGDLPTWWYRDLRLVFADERQLHGWWITGPSRSTPRGLRVGAPRRDLQRLYGAPKTSYGDSMFVYCERRGDSGPRCIFASVAAGRVRDLYIGRTID
jgi:hypothetical protein